MDAYESVDDEISRFRDFRPPWVYIDCPERLFEGYRVKPVAFNQAESRVLLHALDDHAPWMVLSEFRSDSPDGPYGECVCSYENIGHFVYSNA
jgi:hypothetical protein